MKMNGVIVLFLILPYQVGASVTFDNMKHNLKFGQQGFLVPLKYNLLIYSKLKEHEQYPPSVIHILMVCRVRTNEIILNMKYLNINKDATKVFAKMNEEWRTIATTKSEFNETRGLYRIILQEYLEQSEWCLLKIEFSYILNSGIYGYIFKEYRTNIFHSDINTEHPGWYIDEFEEVKSISTFSVAFAVMAYNFITPNPPTPEIEVRLYAEEDTLKLMLEALRVASESIVSFSKFVDIPFPLGKLDFIVVPDDEIDVQDGYGMITLGDKSTLKAFDKNEDNFSYKYSIVSKICHSVSRQYIGHLVTMSKWNETWLHDSFNSFLQGRCVDELYPIEKFTRETDSRSIEFFLSLLKFEERGVHNTIVTLGGNSFFTKYSNSNETYVKVHQVLIMLNSILGPDTGLFQKCIQNYLKKYAGKNTTLEQTWEVFTNTVIAEGKNILPDDITVKDIMESWLTQRGHPLINFTIDDSTGEIIVTQIPFSFLDDVMSSDDNRCWIIPLSYTTKNEIESGEGRVRKWMRCDGKPLVIDDAEVTEDGWIMVDSKLNVPVRVTYDESYWLKIKTLLLSENGISTVDSRTRLRFISDMLVLAKAREMPFQFVFDTLHYMRKEKDYDCWKEAITELFDIRKRCMRTELFIHFEQYIRGITRGFVMDNIYNVENYLGKKDSHDILGKFMLKTNCILEGIECKIFVNKLLLEWKNGADVVLGKIIPKYLRGAIFCFAIKQATKQQREFLFEEYDPKNEQKNESNLNDDILNAMACTNDESALENFFNWGMDSEGPNISNERSMKVFEAVASNKLGYPIITSFLGKKIDEFDKVLPKKLHKKYVDYVKIALGLATNMDELQLICNMALSLKRKGILETVWKEANSIAEMNIQWLESNYEDMLNYLAPE